MLFGEHVSEDVFCIADATVAGTGSAASFVRDVIDGMKQLERFFRRTKREYRRFNYIGEWHSHPSFELHPSATDDRTMFEIVDDPSTGARFALSIIVKLVGADLEAKAYVYFPGAERQDALIR